MANGEFGIDLRDEQLRTAMQSPAQLKQWFRESGRPYLVLRCADLVDGLPWPDGVTVQQQIISGMRDHRRTQPSGWVTKDKAVIYKDELLTPDECDEAIAMLLNFKMAALADLKERGARRE